jgi:hypothetical protein
MVNLITLTQDLIGEKEKDRAAINYWLNKKGGSPQELNEIKSQYPEDFTKKTY